MNTNSIVRLKKKIFFWQILTLEDPKFAQNLAPRAVATALGSLAPLKEPLRMQITHFRFNVQLLGDKMGSHFEFQLFKVQNKLSGSIFVHFFSPKAVVDCSWANGTPGRATNKSKSAFSI